MNLTYDDPQRNVHERRRSCSPRRTHQKWYVPVADTAPRTYQMAITWYFGDGHDTIAPPVKIDKPRSSFHARRARRRSNMLYLGGGIRQVKVGDHDTLQVFSDFSDPQVFYYLPNYPAHRQDGRRGAGDPAAGLPRRISATSPTPIPTRSASSASTSTCRGPEADRERRE